MGKDHEGYEKLLLDEHNSSSHAVALALVDQQFPIRELLLDITSRQAAASPTTTEAWSWSFTRGMSMEPTADMTPEQIILRGR